MNARQFLPYAIGLISFAPFTGQAQNFARQKEAVQTLLNIDSDQGDFVLSDMSSFLDEHLIEATKLSADNKKITLKIFFDDNGDGILDLSTDAISSFYLDSEDIVTGEKTSVMMFYDSDGDYFTGDKGKGTEETQVFVGIKSPGSSEDLKILDPVQAAQIAIQNFRPQ